MRSVFLAFALVAATTSCVAKEPVTPPSTGGSSTGGSASTGGTTSNGGAPETGGKTTSSGGVVSKGGAVGTGGATGTGGSSLPPGSVDCTDTSTFSGSVSGQYGAQQISVDGNSSKTYFMQANWWGTPFNSQTESVNGVGFTMTNPGNIVTSVPSNPLGFPSILIGAYQTKRTSGSNLPKQVSALTSIPTIFSTNADQKGYTSYNAAYDVWFTQGNAPVTGGNPGSGGAYLMVWLFKPTDKQPRGSISRGGSIINGVSGGWDVWYDPSPSDNMPCVSYVSNANLASLQFDLYDFIKDAVADGKYGITNSQYLSIVFAGFEVWGRGDGLQVKQFCANVK
jgi:hypothetical protein